jgi:hypothetical protein
MKGSRKLLPNRLPCEGMKLGESLSGVTNPKKSDALERIEKFLNQLCRLVEKFLNCVA